MHRGIHKARNTNLYPEVGKSHLMVSSKMWRMLGLWELEETAAADMELI
jgi:hypothetical protein